MAGLTLLFPFLSSSCKQVAGRSLIVMLFLTLFKFDGALRVIFEIAGLGLTDETRLDLFSHSCRFRPSKFRADCDGSRGDEDKACGAGAHCAAVPAKPAPQRLLARMAQLKRLRL